MDFDDPEELILESREAVAGGYSQCLKIPLNVQTYITRLRISIKEDTPPQACETFDSGEVEDYTVTLMQLDCMLDHLVASFPDIGVWKRNSWSGTWQKLTSCPASKLVAGDFDRDGRDDLLGAWDTGLFIRYATGAWCKVLNSTGLIDMTAADLDGDGLDEMVGSWECGVWAYNFNNYQWYLIHSTPAQHITAGDLNGDGKDELVIVWDLGIYSYALNDTWERILPSDGINNISTGDMDEDGRDDILGSWESGVWYKSSRYGNWVRLHNAATQLAAGNINVISSEALIGTWTGCPGLWVRTEGPCILWEKIVDTTPIAIATGYF